MKLQKCLTLVDFQRDFVAPQGILTFDNGIGDLELINRMEIFFKKLPKGYFDHGIITYDTHEATTYAQTEEAKNFPLHCAINTKGWQLAIDPATVLNKVPNCQHLRKDSYDMWRGFPEQVDHRYTSSKQDVVLIGVASDICNKAALDGWLQKKARVTIIDDLTRGIFKQTNEVVAEPQYQQALKTGQLRIIKASQFFNEINKTPHFSRGGRL